MKKLWFDWPYIWWKHDYLKKDKFKIIIPNIHWWKDIPIPIVKAIINQLWVEKDLFMNL